MHHLGTKVYLLKRYRPSDSFFLGGTSADCAGLRRDFSQFLLAVAYLSWITSFLTDR